MREAIRRTERAFTMNKEIKLRTEIEALISLADEPDSHLFEKVRHGILNYGYYGLPFLEEALHATDNPVFYERIVSVRNELLLSKHLNELKTWMLRSNNDIFEGYFIVNSAIFSTSNSAMIIEKRNALLQDLFEEYNDWLSPLERVKVLNHVFFDVHQFNCDPDENLYNVTFDLDKILDTYTGNPLSLSMLYISLAQSLKIPLFGVNLPNFFCIAYVDSRFMGTEGFSADEHLLFYINPMKRGVVFNQKRVALYFHLHGLKPTERLYHPCSNRETIQHTIMLLRDFYRKRKDEDKVKILTTLHTVFIE